MGWSLDPGQITRSVNGAPDDWKNKPMEVNKVEKAMVGPNFQGYYTESPQKYNHRFYGPLYFKDLNYGDINHSATAGQDLKSMDLYVSNRGIATGATAFEYPDYDDFHLSGPGIGGKMQLRINQFATLLHKNEPGDNLEFASSTLNLENRTGNNITNRPEFTFMGESVSRIEAPYYGLAQDPNLGLWNNYTGMSSSNVFSLFKTPKMIQDEQNNNGNYFFSGDFNSADNRQHTGNYVEYFTNAEINSFDPTVPWNSLTAKGFLDYRIPPGTRRPSGSFDAEGIGAIKVTDPAGVTYHYALPEYALDETVFTFPLKPDFEFDGTVDGKAETEIVRKIDKYATSWKLTAITGPKYDDTNENGIADEGDEGYWIALSYTQWEDHFDWRTPYYGYTVDLKSKKKAGFYDYNEAPELYTETGSTVSGSKQLYYLDEVRTATQVAFFVKEVREDAHSTDKRPQLRLRRIVLLNSEDAGLFPSDHIQDHTGMFTMPTSSSVLQTVNERQYQVNKAAIEANALQIVEFEQDYSLASNLYNNINSGYATTDKTIQIGSGGSPTLLYKQIDAYSPGTTDKGKLTLNEIKVMGHGYKEVVPSYQFDYDADNTSMFSNPEYNHRQQTYFGFYNHSNNTNQNIHTNQKRSGYVNGTNMNYTDAWSLRKITTPLGSELELDYEPDDYELVGYDGWSGYPVPPTRMFRIKTMSFSTSGTHNGVLTPTITPYDQDGVNIWNNPTEYDPVKSGVF
ncbi:MAG: hypothetical protein AAGB22_04410, partial [Bacteroidota bacterium]